MQAEKSNYNNDTKITCEICGSGFKVSELIDGKCPICGSEISSETKAKMELMGTDRVTAEEIEKDVEDTSETSVENEKSDDIKDESENSEVSIEDKTDDTEDKTDNTGDTDETNDYEDSLNGLGFDSGTDKEESVTDGAYDKSLADTDNDDVSNVIGNGGQDKYYEESSTDLNESLESSFINGDEKDEESSTDSNAEDLSESLLKDLSSTEKKKRRFKVGKLNFNFSVKNIKILIGVVSVILILALVFIVIMSGAFGTFGLIPKEI